MAKATKMIDDLHDILLKDVQSHPKCGEVRFALTKLAEHDEANWHVKSIN